MDAASYSITRFNKELESTDQSGQLGTQYVSTGGTMDLVITGVVVGVLGTLMMDSLNLLFARTGMLSKIEVGMIGRMAVGWTRGRFRYGNPSEMEQVANEMLYGYATHYTIGVALAVPYVIGWGLLVGGPAHHLYGRLPMASRRRQPPTSSFFLPWGWECLAGGLPRALGPLFPPWPTTYSMAWGLRSGSHWCEHRARQNGQDGLCATYQSHSSRNAG
jgi:uncharacterized membrane protein YeaQ/YmgE (transglycosylase-associated protein family)